MTIEKMGMQILSPKDTVFLVLNTRTAEEIRRALIKLFNLKRLGPENVLKTLMHELDRWSRL